MPVSGVNSSLLLYSSILKNPHFLRYKDSIFFIKRGFGDAESLPMSHYFCTEHFDSDSDKRTNLTVISWPFKSHSQISVFPGYQRTPWVGQSLREDRNNAL